MKKSILTIFTLLVLFSVKNVFSQEDMTIYPMQTIPQSYYDNPANMPECKFYFSTLPIIPVPVLGSFFTSVSNSGFTYNNVVKRYSPGDTNRYIDTDALVRKVANKNYLIARVNSDLISFGFMISRNQFINVNISDNLSARFTYPGDFIALLAKGNSQFIGDIADLNGIGIDLLHYRELGVGYTQRYDKNWTFGGRLRMLFGMANIYTKTSKLSLQVEPLYYNLTAKSEILIKSCLPQMVYDKMDKKSTSEFDPVVDGLAYGLNMKNLGGAIDLGATYQINKKFAVGASVTDLGFIRWKSANRTYKSRENAIFTFDGLNITDIISKKDTLRESTITKILDSVKRIFEVDSSSGAYTSYLNPSIFFSGSYNISNNIKVYLMTRLEIYESAVHPTVTLAYYEKVGKALSFTVNYSYMNRSWLNFGLGVEFKMGPIQLWATTDNLLGPIVPQDSRNVGIHLGCNWIFQYKNYYPLIKNN
jgi:hypothetical protein